MMKKPRIPPWARKAIQGITYWIGHRRSLYDQYPLGEAAFVAELCNLVYAHLDSTTYVLRCEVGYKELAGDTKLPSFLGKRARADIVVFKKPPTKDGTAIPKYIIEVKRGSAPAREINNDLKRLAEIARLTTDCRTMLIVVSEAKRLNRFVTRDGKSVGGSHAIPNDEGHYVVRRTAKAAHAFSTIETAQYASLLEVYPHKPPRKRLTVRRVKKVAR